ncbi:MAG: stage II sporulation protein P [Clostridia bacterium]|jgi:stage II sporulation protein P|nr:stage II sporulation protein P [Clostridia bacterium]
MFFKNRWSGIKLYYINKVLFFFVIFFMLVLILVFPLRKPCLQLVLNLASGYRGEPLIILSEGLPSAFSPWLAESYFYEAGWSAWGEQAVGLLTGVKISDPFSLLCAELNLAQGQALAGFLAFSVPLVEEEGGEEDFYLPSQEQELEDWLKIPEDEFPPVQLNGEPMLLVYTTHNAESYRLSQGVARLEGKNGGIAAVSQVLVKALESKHRLKTIYSDVIHDYPDFNKAYLNSRQTVKKILQEYPQIQVVLDVHRDSGLKKRNDTLVRINGKDCAKVLIIVGTAHPQWRQNLAFAQKMESKANELYPGLIKAVRLLKNRTYNQNLHSRALLLEFGSDLNKEEDAIESAKLMAEVLAAVLKN